MRDARDLLLSIPSVLSAGAFFACGPSIFLLFYWAILLLPLMAIYTFITLVFYARRRNPVGLLLALISLAVLGFGTFMAVGILIHGVPLNTT